MGNRGIPGNFKDLTGQVFGRLTAVSYLRYHRWLCRCSCGRMHVTTGYCLAAGVTKSCGCLRIEVSRTKTRTHGMSGTPQYKVWEAIKRRCLIPVDPAFKNYGGRGITVCERWANSFEAFYADVGPRPFPKASIDRIDVNRNYEPGNVRWATKREQCNNTRVNRVVTLNGQAMTATQAAEIIGISAQTMSRHLHEGRTADQIAADPPQSRGPRRRKKADQ